MMKWGFTINAGLGAVLVVSAMGAGSNGEQGLELTLTRTVHGLEELAGIRARLESGDAAAVNDLIRATDAPSANPAAEEARLASLRLEVARLQMIHDGLAPLDAKPETSKKGRDAVQDAASKRADAHGSPASGKPTKGAPNDKNTPTTPDANLTAFEPAGFTVDPVLQGEALFRAERYAECVSVLRKAPDEPRAQYWSARALEKLDKVDDAIALYTTLSARKDGGWAAARAKSDLEFLQWKRDLESRKEPAPSRGGTPSREPVTKESAKP